MLPAKIVREPREAPAGLSQREVALLVGLSRARVHQIEKAALAKMGRHPLMRELAREYGLADGQDAA